MVDKEQLLYVYNTATFEAVPTTIDQAQLTAIRLYLPQKKAVTLCNVYNQPSVPFDPLSHFQFTHTLPGPVLILGDLNVHNHNYMGSRQSCL